MPIIVKRPKALGDLAEIWDYIADDSVERADAFITTIDAKFQTLVDFLHDRRTRLWITCCSSAPAWAAG